MSQAMDVRAAVAFAPNEPLEIVTLQLDPPGEGQALVRFEAAGLCHSDLSLMEGKLPQFAFPIIPGHEGAGIVVACGPGVKGLQPGDHVVPTPMPECRQCKNCLSERSNLCVEMFNPRPSPFSYQGERVGNFCSLATFADHSVISEYQLAKVSPTAPPDIACYIGCGVLTGVGSALHAADLEPGCSVAVFGLGGIGLCALQGARIAGASRIIGIDINPDREGIARELGATDFINPRECNDVVGKIRELSGGGVDFSFECVGNTTLIRQAIECTDPGSGTVVSVGVAGGGAEVSLDPTLLLTGRSWKGAMLGGEKPRTAVPRLVDWYEQGFLKLDSLVSHRIKHDEINRGFDMMRSGEATRTVILY